MPFDDFKHELRIRSALKALARQRVAMIAQPDNVWVLENVPTIDPHFGVSIRTCILRGWVSEQQEIPSGVLDSNGYLPTGPMSTLKPPFYRLTEAGWLVIHRSHAWVVSTFFVGLATLLISAIVLIRG